MTKLNFDGTKIFVILNGEGESFELREIFDEEFFMSFLQESFGSDTIKRMHLKHDCIVKGKFEM